MAEIKLKLSNRTMCFIACVELCNFFSGDATSEKCIKHWSNVMTLMEEMDVEHSELFNEILEQFNDKKEILKRNSSEFLGNLPEK